MYDLDLCLVHKLLGLSLNQYVLSTQELIHSQFNSQHVVLLTVSIWRPSPVLVLPLASMIQEVGL